MFQVDIFIFTHLHIFSGFDLKSRKLLKQIMNTSVHFKITLHFYEIDIMLKFQNYIFISLGVVIT